MESGISVVPISTPDDYPSVIYRALDEVDAVSALASFPRIIVKPKESSVREVIHGESAGDNIVFLGLATPEEGKEGAYTIRMAEMAEGLPTVFFLKNATFFTGKPVGS